MINAVIKNTDDRIRSLIQRDGVNAGVYRFFKE